MGAEYSYAVRILGVDPGSRVCGYGVITLLPNREYEYVECGVLTASGKTMEARLAEIFRSLTEVISELEPEVVSLEAVFAKVNIKSALALAQARGAVLAAAGMAGLKVFSYPPTTVKRAVTGGGGAKKDQVGRMIQVLLNISEPPREDAADALAVAITHAHCFRPETGSSSQEASNSKGSQPLKTETDDMVFERTSTEQSKRVQQSKTAMQEEEVKL